MKRLPDNYAGLSRHTSYFSWELCSGCGEEFRREKGWKKLTGPYFAGHGIFRYVCASCGPTREEAGEVFDGQSWVPKMPKVAPAAPPAPPRER